MIGKRRGTRRGVAAVEFALCSPFLGAILLGLWQMGAMLEAQQAMTLSTREGARWAASGLYTNSGVQQVVIQSLAASGMPAPSATVTVQDLDASTGTDVSLATKGDRILVRASLPVASVLWACPALISPNGSNMVSQAIWASAIEAD